MARRQMMSEWKSNIPEGLDLDSHYVPAKTEKQKEKLSIISKKANAERLADPVYAAKIAEQSRKIALDPERNAKVSVSASKFWNSDTGKHVRSEQQKKNWENNRETMSQALKDRYADGKLGKKISTALKNSSKLKESAQKRTNSIQTPDGVFESRKAAAAFYNVDPTVINGRIKRYPTEYYYISIGNGATGYKNKKDIV